ncbi:MAG: hypothetical protein WED13_04900 [Methyloceanibacter sp.]
MLVLPNVTLTDPIDAEIAAVVSPDDARVVRLRDTHRNFEIFLSKFSDAFGVQRRPSVLILRRDSPDPFRSVEALAGLRDAVSLSLIPYNRARELNTPRGHRIAFSNTLSFYPWMIDRNYEHLLMTSFGHLGIHDVNQFSGQSSPEIFPITVGDRDFDKPLLESLLRRWARRYKRARPEWRDLALFRSLNMANQACRLPAVIETTLYDVGRLLALWVSAFEILAHPGSRDSGLSVVYGLLDGLDFQIERSTHRRYMTYQGRRAQRSRQSLAHWLYGEIYGARNDFLHGNPVTQARLKPRGAQGNLFQYAAPLYRLALTGFLELKFARDMPALEDAEAFGAYVSDHYWFYSYQRTFEEALLSSRSRDRVERL